MKSLLLLPIISGLLGIIVHGICSEEKTVNVVIILHLLASCAAFACAVWIMGPLSTSAGSWHIGELLRMAIGTGLAIAFVVSSAIGIFLAGSRG